MEPHASNSPNSAGGKVTRACQRCRRQKLKCDIQRPCVPCSRSGVRCLPPSPGQWKVYKPQGDSQLEHHSKRTRIAGPEPVASPSGYSEGVQDDQSDQDRSSTPEDANTEENTQTIINNESPWKSSSTMALVDRAFEFHNASRPGSSATSAIPGGHRQETRAGTAGREAQGARARAPSKNASASHPTVVMPASMRSLTQSSQRAVSELTSLFPEFEAAALLVDTYFDRVHWFMLIFHQDEFRARWQKLYKNPDGQRGIKSHDIGFISVFLMVIAIGLQYAGAHRQRLLASHHVDHDKLKERILSALRAKMLDIVSLRSIEAVQTCILLGTYYLFHGGPGLAWPVCGCGLRIAQALSLHRKMPRDESGTFSTIELRNRNETRKRCWWAIYEIETFCSMSYGYPHSIKDADCDVEPLDPSAKSQFAQSPMSFDEPLRCDATLLSYKYFMSKLSVLTKETLEDLYRIGSVPTDNSGSADDPNSLRRLVKKVSDLDGRLRKWYAQVPAKLKLQDESRVAAGYSSIDELDRDIGASGPLFENHIFQLQALALRLAYENARILVHRPLLSYKLAGESKRQNVHQPITPFEDQPDPFRFSLQACRDAALNTSEIVSMPVGELVSGTYATAFVGIHTFTAGITLGILCSIDPLSQESHEAKRGLHRLLSMQTKMRERSPLVAQGLEILQRLTRHVMEKELNAMLDVSKPVKSSMPMVDTNNPGRDVSHLSDSPSTRVSQHPDPLGSASSPQPISQFDSKHSFHPMPDDISINTSPANDSYNFRYVEDPALSQAVYDFDQVISTEAPVFLPQPEHVRTHSPFAFPATDEFPVFEQAWIWGWDGFVPGEQDASNENATA